jgi:hypothetical protein
MNAEQRLLTISSIIAGLVMVLFTPWLVRKGAEQWWIEFAPVWDAPHKFERHDVYPYCPEGHACFFIVAIELIVLILISRFVYRKLGEVVHDYSTYSARQYYR